MGFIIEVALTALGLKKLGFQLCFFLFYSALICSASSTGSLTMNWRIYSVDTS